MIKARIYGAVVCRFFILLVLFTLLVPFFVVYVLCLIGEQFLSLVGWYVADTRAKLLEWNKVLNP